MVVLQLTPSDDLKFLGASFSQLMTAVMISRLVLNLRSVSTEHHPHSPGMHRDIPDQSFLTRTIGNLGGDMFVSGYSTTPGEDKPESEIPLADVARRSEFSGDVQ